MRKHKKIKELLLFLKLQLQNLLSCVLLPSTLNTARSYFFSHSLLSLHFYFRYFLIFSSNHSLHNRPIAFLLIYLHLELHFVVTYLWSALLAVALFCAFCHPSRPEEPMNKKKQQHQLCTARPCQPDLMATNYSRKS